MAYSQDVVKPQQFLTVKGATLWCGRVNTKSNYSLNKLEGTVHYAGPLLAPAWGNSWPFGQNKGIFMLV